MVEIITRPMSVRVAVCAYCGHKATYGVITGDGEFFAYCCSEPTHWAWVVAAIEDEAKR